MKTNLQDDIAYFKGKNKPDMVKLLKDAQTIYDNHRKYNASNSSYKIFTLDI